MMSRMSRMTKEEKKSPVTSPAFECEKCGRTFAQIKNLNRHIREQKLPCLRKFKCDKCPKSFSSKKYLNYHKYVHQKEFLFNCDNCGKKFKNPHTKYKHKIKCNPRSFLSDEEENRKENQDNEEIIPEEDTFEDEKIEMKSDSSDSDVDFEPELKKKKPNKAKRTTQKRFECEKCGDTFSSNANLIRHVNERVKPCVPSRTSTKSFEGFKCDECDKTFSSKSYLEDHKYIHQEEFRFSCDKCGTKFKRRSLFLQHIKRRKCKAAVISKEKDNEDQNEGNQDFISEEESIKIIEVEMDSDFADSGIEFKVPEIPENNNQRVQKALPKSPKENSRKRKRRNLKIKARQVINRVMHYHFNEKNADGSITERWLPVFEVEDFEDVLEFEKFMAKVEFGSEEDIYKPENDYFFC